MTEKVALKSQLEYGPDSGGRMKGASVFKPIVYGNVAKYFGKKREEDGHTHQWTVYVKPYKNEDISSWVKKVHFKLHESYTEPNRVVTKPPYEVTETGWGEFEVQIKIYFIDPNERHVTIYHILKLFETGPNGVINIKKNIVSESYDEIVFLEPSVMMHQLLTNPRQLQMTPVRHETDFEEKREKTLEAILQAKNKIRHEISDMKERLKIAREAISKYRTELQALEQQQQHGSPPKSASANAPQSLASHHTTTSQTTQPDNQ